MIERMRAGRLGLRGHSVLLAVIRVARSDIDSAAIIRVLKVVTGRCGPVLLKIDIQEF